MSRNYLSNLKELREDRNMSQMQLAEALNVDRSTIAKYETGDREPNLAILHKLRKVLDVSWDDLLGD